VDSGIAERELIELLSELACLRSALSEAEIARAGEIAATHPLHRRSAINLVHYVELRTHDVRDLQVRLAELGLSSLGRSEAHVMETVEAVLEILARLAGHDDQARTATVSTIEGADLLARNAANLLGSARSHRSTRIMVTLPSDAADDDALVGDLAATGMDIARVNCAHDDAERWGRMIAHVSATTGAAGHRCLVAMDLGGPKLRTGPLEPGPKVLRIAPRRGRLGHVLSPATVQLVASGAPDSVGSMTTIPIDDPDWIARRHRGDVIELVDSRGARRRWVALEADADSCFVAVSQTSYVSTGSILSVDTGGTADDVRVGELPEVEQAHRVTR
jgi:pyruvate kinase